VSFSKQELQLVFHNLSAGLATTVVLARSDWDAAERAVVAGLSREVVQLRSGDGIRRDYTGQPVQALYRAAAEGLVALIRMEGVNEPLLNLLANLTDCYEARRGQVRQGEKGIFVFAFPDLTTHDAFNCVAMVDAEQFVGSLKQVLIDHTQVVQLNSNSKGLAAARPASGRLQGLRKESRDFADSVELDRIIQRLADGNDVETAKALFPELVWRRLYKQANKLAAVEVGNECLAQYGLELSKWPWRPVTGGNFNDSALEFASDLAYWRGCALTVAVSRPLRRHLLDLLNTPEIFARHYGQIREKCLYALRRAVLDRQEYALLERYRAAEPDEKIGILCLQVSCADPEDSRRQEEAREQERLGWFNAAEDEE